MNAYFKKKSIARAGGIWEAEVEGSHVQIQVRQVSDLERSFLK